MRQFNIDPEFRALIVPLKPEERDVLEESVRIEGCRVPLDVWKEENILLDGHNRLEICEQTEIRTGRSCPYKINYVSLPNRTAAKIWILENQKGRRNLNLSQLSMLSLALETEYAKLAKERQAAAGGDRKSKDYKKSLVANSATSDQDKGKARDKAAKVFGISPRAVGLAKTVTNQGAPELIDSVMEGRVTTTAADRVSRLPLEVQKQAVMKGPAVTKRVSTVIHDLAKAEKSVPGITERAVAKVIHGDAKTPREALESVATDVELEKFKRFDKKVSESTDNEVRKVMKRFNGADKACFLPNVGELWCDDCKWGFDIYLPTPHEAACPYCGGQRLRKRDESWYPGCDDL